MKSFLDIPPAERWLVLDRRLAEIATPAARTAVMDPSEEVSVSDLATKHGIGERAMANRLKFLGGKPYQLGGRWFIRRVSLVCVLEAAEEEKGGQS